MGEVEAAAVGIPKAICVVCERWVPYSRVELYGDYLTEQPIRYPLCHCCRQLVGLLELWAGGPRLGTVIEAAQTALQAWRARGNGCASGLTRGEQAYG